MVDGDAMRASDADRERVVQALQEQVGEGRLTLPEFEQRSDQVYEAKTVGELKKITTDLPVDLFPRPQAFGGAPFGAPWMQPFPAPNIPAWQQRGGPPVRPVRTAPLMVLIGVLVAASVVGTFLLHFPIFLPMIFVFLLMRRGGGGGRGPGPRRYPPYR